LTGVYYFTIVRTEKCDYKNYFHGMRISIEGIRRNGVRVSDDVVLKEEMGDLGKKTREMSILVSGIRYIRKLEIA
jgi:hypothetical protein